MVYELGLEVEVGSGLGVPWGTGAVRLLEVMVFLCGLECGCGFNQLEISAFRWFRVCVGDFDKA